MESDLIIPFRNNGYLAFHLCLYQIELNGIWTQAIYSNIPYTIITLVLPHVEKSLNKDNRIGEKRSSLLLDRIGEKLLKSSIAQEFFYPQKFHHVLDDLHVERYNLLDHLEINLNRYNSLTLEKNPFDLIFFFNEYKLNQILYPNQIKKYISRISRSEFESGITSTKIAEDYICNYSSNCFFKQYSDEDDFFFIQFDLSGVPVFIYAP